MPFEGRSTRCSVVNEAIARIVRRPNGAVCLNQAADSRGGTSLSHRGGFNDRSSLNDCSGLNTLRGINFLSRRGDQRSTHASFVTVNAITSVLSGIARDNAVTILTQVLVASIIFTKIS